MDRDGKPNMENEWVRKTMERMPVFRPYVMFHLYTQKVDDGDEGYHTDSEGNIVDRKDYCDVNPRRES